MTIPCSVKQRSLSTLIQSDIIICDICIRWLIAWQVQISHIILPVDIPSMFFDQRSNCGQITSVSSVAHLAMHEYSCCDMYGCFLQDEPSLRRIMLRNKWKCGSTPNDLQAHQTDKPPSQPPISMGWSIIQWKLHNTCCKWMSYLNNRRSSNFAKNAPTSHT